MRFDVEAWRAQSEKEFESAKKTFKMEDYYPTAFLCQQSVEKRLKALYMHKLKKSPGQTHSLHFLGSDVGMPKDILSLATKLMPDFSFSRYPDVAGDIPYLLYTKEVAQEKLETAEKVLSWIEKQF